MSKKVAIIGANGQLGSDIKKFFCQGSFFTVFPLTHAEIDITDREKTRDILTAVNPNIVINTAAYHKVDEAESNEEKAFLVNAIAQKWLAQLCQQNNWTVVFISTDYVFGLDKKRKKPYKETDLPGPVNVYGTAKLAGEYFTQMYCAKHFIIRTSGLFGVAGSVSKKGNFVELMIRLGREKGKVWVVDDQILAPTYTKNLAENLCGLLKTSQFGIYHMTSAGWCSWWEFARKIFSLLGLKVSCKKVKSGYFKEAARRPNYSVLENYKLKKLGVDIMNTWEENLRLYLQERGYLGR